MKSTYQKKVKLLIFVLALGILTTVPVFNSRASLVDELEQKIKDKNSRIVELQNQAEEYKNSIKNIRIKGQTLQNEIEILDAETAQLELEMKMTQTETEKVGLEIDNLEIKIQKKEKEIKRQKEVLAILIRQINDYDQETTLEILLKNSQLSDFLNELEYIGTMQENVQETLEKLKETKAELKNKKKEMENKKEELEKLERELETKKEMLSIQKEAKKRLLEETKNKEYKFQNLLSNIHQQKSQILGEISSLRKDQEAEIARLSALEQKPADSLASTSWYFSQQDPRWANKTIGFSNSSIRKYGCAVSCVAMVFKYYGIDIDPGRLARQRIFYRDLISWPSHWRFLDLQDTCPSDSKRKTCHQGVNWGVIDKEIAAGHPVIVFIRANGRKAGHYVVIHSKDSHGKYVIHDPIRWAGVSGANIYLDSTRKYIGSVYNTTTTVDQMIIYK